MHKNISESLSTKRTLVNERTLGVAILEFSCFSLFGIPIQRVLQYVQISGRVFEFIVARLMQRLVCLMVKDMKSSVNRMAGLFDDE